MIMWTTLQCSWYSFHAEGDAGKVCRASSSEGGMGMGSEDEPDGPKLAGDAWQLPTLQPQHGPGEVDVRLPPLSPGACFSDEYQVCAQTLLVDHPCQHLWMLQDC